MALSRSLLFASLALLAAPQAWAQQGGVSPDLCRALVMAPPDASVDYAPGVDFHGNPVTPADLPDSPKMAVPDTIRIPLTLNLAKALNMNPRAYPANQLGSGTEVPLGTLTVEGGHVLLDGKPLTADQQERLAILCIDAL